MTAARPIMTAATVCMQDHDAFPTGAGHDGAVTEQASKKAT